MSEEHGALMSPEREHIELFKASRIRINQDPVNREDFANSLQQIATGLYKAREHFIFELIQNADDNEYECEPKLSFTVKHVADNVGPYLVVTNTEKGFTKAHVIGICRVGKTTKKDKARYIGEKGIGFKSVFNVTHCPQIHSNGYHYRLPDTEHDVDAKLGFVVPYWVDPIPDGISSEGTTILLPLKTDCTEMICKKLKEFSPETIMFLRKIKNIEMAIDIDETHTQKEIEWHREKVKDRLISLKVRDETDKTTTRYWMARRQFSIKETYAWPVPNERLGLEYREVTVAIPLDSTGRYPGKLFAYLPVNEETGLPFLVNADFLLAANREDVTGSTWNDWLRDRIAPVYVHAFVTGVQSSRLPIQDKARLYESLPFNDTVYPFLAPVRQHIKDLLKEVPCVLTVSGKTELPGKCKRFKSEHREWRSLLMEYGEVPAALASGSMVVHAAIEGHGNELKFLGVPWIEPDDIYKALADAAWIGKRDSSWFVRLYLLLNDKMGDLASLPIFPVMIYGSGERVCRCTRDSHIYLRLSEEDKREIDAFPEWARACVPLASLDPELLTQIEAHAEGAVIFEALTKLGVKKSFQIDVYASTVIKIVGAISDKISKEMVFELTDYLLRTDRDINTWSFLPVVLSNGLVTQMSMNKSISVGYVNYEHEIKHPAASRLDILVVPDGFDESEGWQHIWQSPEHRRHFKYLHRDYLKLDRSVLDKLKVRKYPYLEPVTYYKDEQDSLKAKIERELMECAIKKAADAHQDSIRIFSYRVPMIGVKLNDNVGRAVVKWMNDEKIDLTNTAVEKFGIKSYAFNYRDRGEVGLDSAVGEWLKNNPWLPTTNGLRKPSEAYLSTQSIKEIFGDQLAYFEGALPPGTIKYLGIKAEITVETLIGELRKQAGRADADVGLLTKIYGQLMARGSSVKDAFSSSPLIAVEGAKGGVAWYTVSECVWEDASDSAGDKFCYLENRYPELKPFFVNVLGVRERVCADLYLDQLATLSRQCAQEIDEVGLIYQHLDKYGQNEVSPERFEREKLIAVNSSDGPLRWHRLSECVWEAEAVFADMFGCLKQAHPALKSFFCSRLKVRQRLELKDYLDCWVKLQEPTADPLTPQRKLVVESLYRAIALCLDGLDSEPFTSFFSKKPRVYTDSNVFRTGAEVYWPDDGQLKDKLSDVEYAWLPDQATHEQWKGFFDKMGVRLLSQCVRVEMLERPCAPAAGTNRYLTPEAAQLLSTCIWQKDGNAYQRLLREGKFEQLVGTREVNVENRLKVRYTIASMGETAESPVYWDSQKRLLYVIREDPKTLKRKIATHLALSLIDKSYDSDFENYLEEDNLDRLKDKSWKVPSEISALFGSATPCHTEDQQTDASAQPGGSDTHQVSEVAAVQPMAMTQSPLDPHQSSGIPQPPSVSPAPVPHPHPSVSVSPHRSASRDTPVAKTVLAAKPAFNPFEDAPGIVSLEPSDDEEPRGGIRNAERFCGVVSADARARLHAEPPPDERRSRSESVRLECSDPQVRTALFGYYGGKCQMCHRTFPKRDGEPYFVATHYVGREDGRYLDCVDNAICLCAEHFAKWQHAARVFDKESTKRVLMIDPNARDPVVRVQLAGKNETITYVPSHLAKFQALCREAGPRQEPGSADQEPQADSGACDAHSGL